MHADMKRMFVKHSPFNFDGVFGVISEKQIGLCVELLLKQHVPLPWALRRWAGLDICVVYMYTVIYAPYHGPCADGQGYI